MHELLKLSACVILLMVACRSDLPPERYLEWVAQHRELLSAIQVDGGIQITLTYLPADWLAINESGTVDPNDIVKTRQEYAGLEYYRLRVALQSGQGDALQFEASSNEDYYRRVEYFSFGLQHDLRLLTGSDTLPCKLFHFERNYGAAPFMDFMLGFETRPGSEFDRTLLYDDRVYSRRLVRLTIPYSNIHRIPILKL